MGPVNGHGLPRSGLLPQNMRPRLSQTGRLHAALAEGHAGRGWWSSAFAPVSPPPAPLPGPFFHTFPSLHGSSEVCPLTLTSQISTVLSSFSHPWDSCGAWTV